MFGLGSVWFGLGCSSSLRESAAGQGSAFGVAFAREQVLVGLAVLGAHDHVDDGVDARRQIDQNVADDVEGAQVVILADDLDNGDGHVADDERHENDQDHLQQLAILGCHPARMSFGARRAPVEGAADLRHRRAERQRRRPPVHRGPRAYRRDVRVIRTVQITCRRLFQRQRRLRTAFWK